MLALLLAVIQPLACHLIQSDTIYGRDLAAAVPAFSAIEPDARLSLAPLPGQQRVFRVPELKRLASANHLDGEISEDVCFAWKMAVPDQNKMLAAMQKTLENRNPAIQIVESSLIPAPEGEIVFPLTGLIMGSSNPSVWRGFVRYAGTKKFPIWARVQVAVKERRVIAAIDMHEGDALSRDQMKVESYEGPLSREKYLLDASSAAGLLLRRPVAKGTALTEDMLETPREVTRGETVDAIVQNGAARLDVQGIAEDNGRKGQIISIRNPRSGRIFRARVEDKGTVVVVPGGQYGLVVESKKS